VIPITQKAKPDDFDTRVQKKGLDWLKKRQISPNQPLPPKTELPDYWTTCIPDLRAAYNHICAYVCIHIEEVTGSATVEHFKPKSLYPGLAYTWDNYLLVCGTMNGRKGDYEDVLNPFSLEANTFFLNLVDGSIRPNPDLPNTEAAQLTIKRLGLDNPECRKLRLRYWEKYRSKKIVESELLEMSPFAYLEAQRQNLL
jgi:uncharacterized protein (TIGR02646 family)